MLGIVVKQGIGIQIRMPEYLESIAIISVQTIAGCQPHKPARILRHVHDQMIGNSIALIQEFKSQIFYSLCMDLAFGHHPAAKDYDTKGQEKDQSFSESYWFDRKMVLGGEESKYTEQKYKIVWNFQIGLIQTLSFLYCG